MTDNNKFIKLPETKTEIILNQEQNQTKQEQIEKEKELKTLESYGEEIEASGQTSGVGPSSDDTADAVAKGALAGLNTVATGLITAV
jgi:hypothetical protein